MIVAEHYANYLAKKGCTHFFGVIGGANLALVSEMAKKMKYVACHHEQAAAGAAYSFYKVSRQIAPCLVTAGGGSCNAITGVVAAYMDSIPLLVISGNEMGKFFGNPFPRQVGFQGFNPEDAVQWCTKSVVSVRDPLAAEMELDRMFRICQAPRQGSVWLDVPQTVATSEL